MNTVFRKARLLFGVGVFTCAVLATGCGGKYFRTYVQSMSSPTLILRESGGLRVAVDPFVDEARCQQSFGLNCPQNGLLPVYVSLSNAHPTVSYRLVTTNIWFGADGRDARTGGILGPSNAPAATGLGWYAAWAAGVGIFALGANMKAIDDEESVRENFTIKQFQNVTLPPGKFAEGFVYYVQSEPVRQNSLPSVHIPVLNLQTSQTNTISISLKFP